MISKEPEVQNIHTKNFYFTKSARIGFSHLLKCVFSNRNRRILIPAYIGETDKEGSGVFDPIRENKIKYDFYLLKRDLSADIEDLRPKIVSGKYLSLLIIHYFGFVQNNMEELYSLCKKNDVILIEDCAHSLFSMYKESNIGELGDLSFFSIHKIIATQDGGYFRINNNVISIDELSFEDQNITPTTLEQFIRTDYEKINKIRRSNYQRYLNSIHEIRGVYPLYPELPKGIIPLNFPIIVENGFRERLYFRLLEKGVITCALYYRLVKEIDKDLYPISHEISQNILNFPTHQDTSSCDIENIILKLKESIKEIL